MLRTFRRVVLASSLLFSSIAIGEGPALTVTREHLVGTLDPYGDDLTSHLDVTFASIGNTSIDSSRGQFRCSVKRSDCPGRRGHVTKMRVVPSQIPGDRYAHLVDIDIDLALDGGVGCHLTAVGPDMLVTVPALSGSYRCVDAGGVEMRTGWFTAARNSRRRILEATGGVPIP